MPSSSRRRRKWRVAITTSLIILGILLGLVLAFRGVLNARWMSYSSIGTRPDPLDTTPWPAQQPSSVADERLAPVSPPCQLGTESYTEYCLSSGTSADTDPFPTDFGTSPDQDGPSHAGSLDPRDDSDGWNGGTGASGSGSLLFGNSGSADAFAFGHNSVASFGGHGGSGAYRGTASSSGLGTLPDFASGAGSSGSHADDTPGSTSSASSDDSSASSNTGTGDSASGSSSLSDWAFTGDSSSDDTLDDLGSGCDGARQGNPAPPAGGKSGGAPCEDKGPAIPEPATLALMLAGLAGLAAVCRKRRRG